MQSSSFDKVLYKFQHPHGAGDVYFIWQKGQSRSLLATTGADGTVALFDRQGQLVEKITLPNLCSGFAWDKDGALLGIIAASTSAVTLWDSATHRTMNVELGLKDALSCIIWSKRNQMLAVGTVRGNLAIYNHVNGKRIPVFGKHSKRITCGAWSSQNLLALGSEDKTFSLSNEEGDSVSVIQLRDVPSDLNFAEMSHEQHCKKALEIENLDTDNVISMIIGKRTLYLYYLPEPDSPTELGFQSRYGSLLQHKWFGRGYILLGFSNGHVVAISTHPKDIGQELWQVKNHRELLTGLAYSPTLELVASCGDDTIKIHSIANLHETEKIIAIPDRSGVQMIDWSGEGQLLAVSTTSGSIYIYVTKLQTLFSVSAPRIAILSSLAEISIYAYSPEKANVLPYRQPLQFEPHFIGIGPYHLVTGVDRHMWIYYLGRTLGDQPQLLGERDFPKVISEVQINADYYAVWSPPELILQSIPNDKSGKSQAPSQIFPNALPALNDSLITSFVLCKEFLIMASDVGHLIYFSLEKWDVCSIFRHNMGIQKIYADSDGIRLILIDDYRQGFVYLPALDETIPINDFPAKCESCLWDLVQPNHFVIYDGHTVFTYILIRYSIMGKHTQKASGTLIKAYQLPILLYDGEIMLLIDNGQYVVQVLNSHIVPTAGISKAYLKSLLQLRKYDDALILCDKINLKSCWLEYGEQALSDLDPQIAILAYRKLGDIGMVTALESMVYLEDINVLSGFCCLLLERYDDAQNYFLKGTYTKEALDLCRDLLKWEQALLLAQKFEPNEVPLISREYAQQLEYNGNFNDALYHYEKAYPEDSSGSEVLVEWRSSLQESEFDKHVSLCRMGVARCSIRVGDFKRGIQYATKMNNPQLYNDCAEILATVGHDIEAADLYEKGQYFDEACALYIALKMWNKAKQILDKVKNFKLHAAFAQAKEANGNYEEAIEYYQFVGDMDACVRIYIKHLSDPHAASEIVLETRSIESAKLLANFYQKIGDIDEALQFLVICGCIDEAFALAMRHNKLKRYGELLERYENAKASDYLTLAQYFENEKYTLLAGKYYLLAKEFTKALRFLLKASTFNKEEPQALSLAIDCVASSNNEQLARQLIGYLLGDVDGTPKDPRYLFRLYMARKHYKDAAKTAVIIANQEQLSGNYKTAHNLLFTLYQELRRNNLTVTAEMTNNLILLHRYTLVRIHIKLGNHLMAAKLLIEVAASISQFPLHIVPILTSTVIECNRSGLKKAAYKYASMLMRPEYRSNLDARYAKKIESIVRKAPKGIKDFHDEIDDETMECPICNTNLGSMDICCIGCKSNLPICIATGQHIIKEQMASCPACDFPCFRAIMENILSELHECPMCEENVEPEQLLDIEDIRPYIFISSSFTSPLSIN